MADFGRDSQKAIDSLMGLENQLFPLMEEKLQPGLTNSQSYDDDHGDFTISIISHYLFVFGFLFIGTPFN